MKSIKELAKEYNAEIYEENFDDPTSGQLMRTFSVDEYEDYMEFNEELNGYVDPSSQEYNEWQTGKREWMNTIEADTMTESIIVFKDGEPVAASYSYVRGNTASMSFDDDVDGVIDLWTE